MTSSKIRTTSILSTFSLLLDLTLEILYRRGQSMVAANDAIINIRPFHPNDNEAVRELFVKSFGTAEEGSLIRNVILAELSGGATFVFYFIGIMGLVLLVPWGESSAFQPALGAAMILTCLGLVFFMLHSTNVAFLNFLSHGLTGDLSDTGKYYGNGERIVAGKTSKDLSGKPSCENAFWVAEMITPGQKSKIVGGIGFDTRPDPVTGLIQCPELRRMMVSPLCRRRGVGGQLLRAALSYGKEHGLKSFSLATSSYQNSAIELYQKHGFVMQRKWELRNGIWVANLRLDLPDAEGH
ncbi:hypothetical protein D9613_003456 [Agrocybe pediades]|uniref:N-acetyltransferase domain-containing protein n=1 Tax=Agrocybe pediades TaxID=84607 RepID=A0A8H4QQ58_9AGAR|nr:hypothetical protein D9613_003456 [Agrocybe pediades]